ncbi:hypothetical protein [Helicobacter pylori]|uniref:hypothetical protein n=1 Tax=Helicobacter pylori TaxID=210 RepID=UPI00038D0CCB|nr:hypothetical protein [Helicobacter pylori]EQD96410.1 hypothetical protein L930_06495 [Helicobacter pylori PZ5004]QTP03752.1 hypothetical protein J5D22_05120 [Helicobacter pylori]WQU37278.1 hypothetical protein KVC64_05115 [Helicobacter pylori]
MRFKSVVAFISLAVALGVLAYLFLSVKKEMPVASHAISQTNAIPQTNESLSQTNEKSHEINLEESPNNPNTPNDDKISHNEEDHNNTLSQSLDAQEVINYPVVEHHFEIPFEEKKREYSKLIIKDLKDYQWWCLKEILKKEQIDYAYDNTKNQSNLIIYLDENKKERLLADLDYYKIRYHAVF